MSTLTIQPATSDSYLSQVSPYTNHGSDTDILVGDGTAHSAHRGILGFDFSALASGSLISDAVLGMYYFQAQRGDPTGRTYWAYRITQKNWTQTGVTWNKYDGTNAWNTAGGDYTTTDGASAVIASAGAWVTWTVTNQVKFAQSYTSKIANFLIMDGDETSNNDADFYSNNYTTDPTKCPYLTITYTLGTGWSGKIDQISIPTKVNNIASILKINGIV